MLTDLFIFRSTPLLPSYLHIAERTCTKAFYKLFVELIEALPHSPELLANLPQKKSFSLNKTKYDLPMFGLGQLFQKEEAAGKIRTFAIVDCWTQTILSPLHRYLSDLLKRMPNDGTASHSEAFDRVRIRSAHFGCAYGYDLSAATDRLPISLQVKLIQALFGVDFGNHWRDLLVGRPYYLLEDSRVPRIFRYAVGQPMGARSSFTMLSLTHHMLVQFAASQLRG